MHIPAALIDATKDRYGGKVVLFAGAGMSMKAIGFGGRHIRDTIGKEIRKDFPTYKYQDRTFEDVCDEYVALNDRMSLVTRLAAMIPKTAQPQPGHLAAIRTFRFIITTNWDLLFEVALQQTSGKNYHVLSSDQDAPMFGHDEHNLLKIHGSADRPMTLVATTDDYENYDATHAQLLDRVYDLVFNNIVLYAGYGLRDEHVRHVIAGVRKARGQGARKAYAVGFYDPVRKKLLETRGIEVIEADVDDFLPELAKRAGF
jgi:hypothetical protein